VQVRTSRARVAVTAVFFLNGAVFSSWYARLPDIQQDVGIGNGALGIALLGAPVGLLLAQPVAGAVAARIGSRPLVAAAPLLLAPVVLPALAVDAPTLLLATLTVGAANGVLDISMNVQGLAVERAGDRRIFNSLHAGFSFGALAGAVLAGAAVAAGLAPLPHLAIAAAVGAAATLAASRWLLPAEADARPGGARVARPSRRLAALGIVAFCALLAEGAVFDWSGIYLAREAGAQGELAPAGLAAFSLTMAAGRLTADRTAALLGSAAVARAGALAAGAGLGVAIVSGSPAGGIAGFAVMGLGLSAVFPLSLRAAGEDPERAGPALAAVSTLGYTGFLAGPPAIGLLAELLGLGGALACVCALLALAALLAGHLGERSKAAAEHA
jgi:predicted MFS family arabinose efflux permease